MKHYGNGIWEVRRPWRPLLDALHDRPANRPARNAEKATGDARSGPAPRAPEGILRVARSTALWAIAVIIATASGAAFAESYRGLYLWALHHGLSGFWAAAFPLQVDSFIGVGGFVLFIATVDRWNWRQRTGAWAVALAGLAVSVGGNIGHVAAHDAQSRGTAAVPRWRRSRRCGSAWPSSKRVLERAAVDEPPAEPVPGLLPEIPTDAEVAALIALRATTWAGNALSGRQLETRFGLTRQQATRVRQLVGVEANGHHTGDGQDDAVSKPPGRGAHLWTESALAGFPTEVEEPIVTEAPFGGQDQNEERDDDAIEGEVVPFPGVMLPVARPQGGEPGEWKAIVPAHLRTWPGVKKAARRHLRKAGHHAAYHGVRSPWRIVATIGWASVGLTRIVFGQIGWWWLSEQTYLRHQAVADNDANKWLALNKHARQVRVFRGFVLLGEAVVLVIGGVVLSSHSLLLWIPVGAAVVPVLAWIGRPYDKPIVTSAVVPVALERLTIELIVYDSGLLRQF